MSFAEAVRSCLSRYATFHGRAPRSEYWWFGLAVFLASVVAAAVDGFAIGYSVLGAVVSLGTILPSTAAACRRLHDTDRSGWWQLIVLVPLVGVVLLIVWLARAGTPGYNRFGAVFPQS